MFSARRRTSYVIFVDRRPAAACMALDLADALSYGDSWVADREEITAVPESHCSAADLAALHASESARCDGWTTARAAGVDGSLSIA